MGIKIGDQFVRRGTKRKDVETVTDIYTTTNIKGEVVKVSYVASHMFMGQLVYDHDVSKTTILRFLIN